MVLLLRSRLTVAIAALFVLGSQSSNAGEISLTQRYPITVSRPDVLMKFRVSSCADCDQRKWTKIEISGGSPKVQQSIRIGGATDEIKLQFADIDGDGVREFFVRGVHGFLSAQVYKLGGSNRFEAVPVLEPNATNDSLLQFTKPYAISQAVDISVVSPGIVAVRNFGEENDEPAVVCYLMRSGELRQFASWEREDSQHAWEGVLYIPKRRPSASAQTIAVQSVNYREGRKVVWTELCRRSANRYYEKIRKR